MRPQQVGKWLGVGIVGATLLVALVAIGAAIPEERQAPPVQVTPVPVVVKTPTPSPVPPEDPGMSLAEYNAISIGMTYEQVESIVGGLPTRRQPGAVGEEVDTWVAEGEGAPFGYVGVITFDADGKVLEKAENGLGRIPGT